jgi:hypothetical protein
MIFRQQAHPMSLSQWYRHATTIHSRIDDLMT